MLTKRFVVTLRQDHPPSVHRPADSLSSKAPPSRSGNITIGLYPWVKQRHALLFQPIQGRSCRARGPLRTTRPRGRGDPSRSGVNDGPQ